MTEVTVIIPVYNAEPTLGRCLESLFKQTCRDFEIICIDDKSTDGSLELLARLSAESPVPFQVISNSANVGQGRSRMAGIARSSGSYIAFVDSDDYVDSDYIEVYLNALRSSGGDVAVGGHTRDVDGRMHRVSAPGDVWCLATYSMACAKVYRKNFITAHGIDFTDIRRGEDIYFNLSLYYWGARVTHLDYFGYHYVLNRASTTGSLKRTKDHERYVSALFDRFRERHDLSRISDEKYRVVEYSYIANMVNALITYDHGCGLKQMREKYRYVFSDAARQFPRYADNPLYGLRSPDGQTAKIRLSLGVLMVLHKASLDKYIYYLIALI